MPDSDNPPELLRLLYRENLSLAVESAGERLLQWAAAFDDWLNALEQARGRVVRGNSLSAWRDFLAFYQGLPWNVQPADIERWLDELQQHGRSPDTMNRKIHTLRDFYRHCQQFTVDPLLPPGFNPAQIPLRTLHPPYLNLVYLNGEEARALLAAVDRDRSLVGKRDYAMLLLALRTGLEAGQIRQLRWGDLLLDEEPVRCICRNTPQHPPVPIPCDAWNATHEYLQASGRLPSMSPEMFLFAPLSDPLGRPPTGQASDWADNRPISASRMRYLITQYAAWAGLDETQVNWNCLHHTATVLRVESGDSPEQILRFLGRTQRRILRAFLKQYRQQPKKPLWRSPPAESGQGDSTPDPLPPSHFAAGRRPPGAQKGNLNGIKTGFFAKQSLPADPAEPRLPPALRMQQMEGNVQNILDRTLSLVDGTQSMDEMLRLADIYSRTTGRMVSMMKAQGGLKSLSAAFREYTHRAIDQAISEVAHQVAEGTFPCENPRLGPKDDELIAAFVRLVRLILDHPDKVDDLYRNEP